MYIKKENGQNIRYPELRKYRAEFAGNFREQSDEIHRREGFIKVPDAVFDSETHYKTGEILEVSENVFEWEVKEKVLPTLEEALNSKLNELSGIANEYRNELFRTNYESLILGVVDSEYKTLVTYLQSRKAAIKAQLELFYANNDLESLLSFSFDTEENNNLKAAIASFSD